MAMNVKPYRREIIAKAGEKKVLASGNKMQEEICQIAGKTDSKFKSSALLL